MKAFRREKLNSLYRELASAFLEQRGRMEQGVFSVTRAELSEKGERVKIYFSVWPDEKEPDVLKFLQDLKKELREHLARKIDAKAVPELEFSLDESEKRRLKIEELLKKAK